MTSEQWVIWQCPIWQGLQGGSLGAAGIDQVCKVEPSLNNYHCGRLAVEQNNAGHACSTMDGASESAAEDTVEGLTESQMP